jgi:SAM-dependent methyltransferase
MNISHRRDTTEPAHLGGWIPLDQRSITPTLWRYLLKRYRPQSMIDVGCGEAWPALWFQAHGVDSFGIDGSERAEEASVLPSGRFIRHDFATEARGPLGLGERQVEGREGSPILDRVDLVFSVEFVEHVEERFLPNILDVFARARVVAMTHAWVNQGGHHHVNCQDQPYWVEKLASIGFRLDEVATRETRALPEVQQRDAYWGRTGLVFVR